MTYTVFRDLVLAASLAAAGAMLPSAAVAAALWKVVSVEGNPAPGATFEISAGKVAGNGGCNSYSGPAKFVRGRVQIGPLVATRMACDNSASEQAFFSALERAYAFNVDGGTMVLLDEAGMVLVSLSR